ncbi:PREDICTED: odorant receptor 4-like [Dufourea novaeangliae]|uniref:odorant receptor 4-like n=1 Tax=Dufourea novaeangliae TaxID=178035 RepID=UPI00076731C1|nr:PREDICTED: odorant receptor 4-like [Dufourea novaeangliae]
METDWKTVKRPHDRQLMLKSAKIGRIIMTVAALCMNIGVFSYNFVTGLKKTVLHVGNESYSTLRLPCPFYTKLMDVRYSPANEIVFFLQCFSGLIVNSVTVGACGLAAVFAMHACGQLNIVMSQLEDLVERNKDQPSAQRKMASIVDIHLRALNRAGCQPSCSVATVHLHDQHVCSIMQPKGQNRLNNYDHETDLDYTLEMCRWLLTPIGVWPLVKKCAGKHERAMSIVLLLVCFTCLLFVILPSGYNIFFVEKSMQNKVKLLGPVGFCLSSAIKYCYLVAKGTVFGRCIEHVQKDWQTVEQPCHRDIMLKHASLSRQLIAICAIFLYTGGMSYHTVMQFLSKDRSKRNFTVRPLTYPCFDTFLDTQSSPTYEIVFSVHCVAAMIMYSVTTAAYSLAATFVTHICGQIQIQMARLENLLGDSREKSSFHDRMTVIVRSHVQVLRFSKNVEKALRGICLTEIVESTLIMCLLEYYCMMEWRNSDAIAILTYLTLLISFTFNVLIFCYIGEVLSEQCSKMGPASYNVEWYNLPAKEAHNLVLVSAISLYPPKLTAGKIIELSLNTFGTVVRTSVIYLNLLRTVTTW